MKTKAGLLALLFLTSLAPLGSAFGSGPVSIHVDWTGDNAYIIQGEVDLSNISATHMRGSEELDVGIIYDTTGEDLRIELNTSLVYGDVITIDTGEVSRTVTVGLWGQPMDDHEVTLDSEWVMDQQWENENGTQKYLLIFNGQGWQQRIGNTLESWEMGNGSLDVIAGTSEGNVTLSLLLESIWKNETTVDGLLTGQVFDARGSGTIVVAGQDENGDLVIDGVVSDAWVNRSLSNGIVDERSLLEANGTIGIYASDEDGSFNLTGELAVLYIETWDSNGTRRLSNTEFDATADLIIESNDTRMDISLDTFESRERWDDGVRTDQYTDMVGHGTFGIVGQDENASVYVNGTIHDFHRTDEDGLVTEDALHVDGTITGDAQGSFGVVREIENPSYTQENENGTPYEVIIIHQEDWFNLTGGFGLPNSQFPGGTQHNESWSYDAIQSGWENRTIRRVWSQTGADPSSGDELVPNSPIEIDAEPPEVNEVIGDVTINRESGFAPINSAPGDVFTLDAQDGMKLTVTTGELQTIPMDGHLVDTVAWTGVYANGITGFANGNLIIDGPLSGLNVIVNRTLQVPFGEDDAMVNLTENQSVNRVLSPSIISAHDNTPPSVVSASLREGLVTGEGGMPAHLEVAVADIDFNIKTVVADLSAIGEGIVSLSDKGLQGDSVIGDDIWTAIIQVNGTEIGNVSIPVTVTDAFSATGELNATIEVRNQPPRLTSMEMVPHKINREEIMLINAEVIDLHGVESVEIDMREHGGSLEPLNRLGEIWVGQVEIPDSMSPVEHLLNVRMIDSQGASVIVTRTSLTGQHHLDHEDDVDLVVEILNTPPQIHVGDLREIIVEDEDVEYTLKLRIADQDGLMWAKVKLGSFAPPGSENKWLVMTPTGDGNYTYTFTVRSGIALSTYEILVKARDSYGEESPEVSVPIVIKETDDVLIGIDGPSSKTLTYVALAGMGILAIIGATIYVRRGGDDESSGLGGFGEV